jgi:CBS domain containing-hemolysin-like protein/mannitol/fructose-specific phosphotransferase system IIA component (Ntr-type)
MWADVGLGLLAFGLVLLNGFFVLAEFAIVKVRASRLEERAAAGSTDAAIARHAISKLDAYLSATQLGITLASLALGWIGEPAFAALFQWLFDLPGAWSSAASHSAAVFASFFFITFLHVLVGELAPKSIAIAHPEAASLFVARPLRFFYRAFLPLLWLMNGAARRLLRLLGVPPASDAEQAYSEEELRSILGASQERGGFSFHHLLLLENAFDFGQLRVKDVAVPLERVAVLDAGKPWPENAAVIRERRLSRYPVRDGGRIAGVVHVKGVALDLMDGRIPDLRTNLREVLRIPEDVLLEAALRRLQGAGEHMGVAVATNGVEKGIFTLEDIVEELIGDVRDEFERRKPTPMSELLLPTAVLLDVPSDRTEAISALVTAACEASNLPVEATREAVLRREREVPTSVGEGVAIPHARLPGLARPVMAFGRARGGIAFEAPDGRDVRLVVLLLTPAEDPGIQLRLLRRVAEILQSDYLRSRLLEAESVEDVRETFRIGDASAHV